MSAVDEETAVLIADSEALSRIKSVVMFLEARFKVYEAADANEAVQLLGLRRDIGVMLVDHELRGSMNGLELARYAGEHFGRVHVLLTSRHRRVDSAQLPGGAVFLEKPYHIDRVREKLRPMSV